MKTWEMIKELTENPEKKFKVKNGARQIEICNNNLINSYSMANYIITAENLSWEWEEVKEPVDFMTAIKSGRFIKVEHELITHCRYSDYERLDLLMLDLADDYAESDLTEILENGKWYIG